MPVSPVAQALDDPFVVQIEQGLLDGRSGCRARATGPLGALLLEQFGAGLLGGGRSEGQAHAERGEGKQAKHREDQNSIAAVR